MSSNIEIFESYADDILNEIREGRPPKEVKDETEDNEPYDDHIPNDNYRDRIDPIPLGPDRQGNDNPFDLDPEEEQIIDGKIKQGGFEVLAFYKSIHNLDKRPYPGRWGIFVYDWALDKLGKELSAPVYGGHNPYKARNWALRLIHRHEMYHFYVDAWTLSREALLGKEIYGEYLREVYNVYRPGLEVVEESLANRLVFNSLGKGRRLHEIKDWALDFMNRQPGAYANFRGDQDSNRAQLASQILNGKKWAPGMFDYSQAPWMKFNSNEPLLHPDNCPNWLIRDLPITGLPALCYALPDHKEIQKFLKHYCAGAESKTDHTYVRIDNGRKVKVPNKHHGVDCIRPDEFRNILYKSSTKKVQYYSEKDRTKGWKPKYCPRSLPS
jgi:hypothetical protein